MIQTWSCSSTQTPIVEPSSQWFGSGFGQNGSTSNIGACTLRALRLGLVLRAPPGRCRAGDGRDQHRAGDVFALLDELDHASLPDREGLLSPHLLRRL